jgi:hypothetical protein
MVSRALRWWFVGIWVGLAVAGLAGCGNGNCPVHGRLEFEDGEPIRELAGSSVTFTSEQLGVEARGEIQDDGSFRLGMKREDDGAPSGKYKVILTQPHPSPERQEHRRPVVDTVYEDPDKTPLEATVDRQHTDFTFKLKPIKGKK